MPPKSRAKPPTPPVPGVEETPPELCGGCFPYGLDGTPEGAIVVSCAHGAWVVADLVKQEPPTPVTPASGDTETPEGGQGNGDETPADPDGKGDDGK
jgi:hypothetical protein